MKKLFMMMLTLALLSACQPSSKPISYGSDFCHHCKMTIVDPVHGAELVTKKSKVFKFDAIECMTQFVAEKSLDEFALFLVNDFNNPKELIDATKSSFLISKAIPSPMGAYLSAFNSVQEVQEVQAAKGGDILTWMQLLDQYEVNVNSMNNR